MENFQSTPFFIIYMQSLEKNDKQVKRKNRRCRGGLGQVGPPPSSRGGETQTSFLHRSGKLTSGAYYYNAGAAAAAFLDRFMRESAATTWVEKREDPGEFTMEKSARAAAGGERNGGGTVFIRSLEWLRAAIVCLLNSGWRRPPRPPLSYGISRWEDIKL